MKSLPPAQFRLLRDLLLVSFVAVALLIFAGIYSGDKSRTEYSKAAIDQAIGAITRDFTNGLLPYNENLIILQKWGSSQVSTIDRAKILNVELLNARVVPILESLGTESFFHLATSRGQDYLLYYKDQHWLTRSSDPEEWGKKQKWRRWGSDGVLIEEWWSSGEYDPRQEPWYKRATESGSQAPVWTDLYVERNEYQPVISGAIQWQRQDDRETLFVAAFDIPLRKINTTVRNLKSTERSLSFLAANDGRLLSLRRQAMGKSEESQLSDDFILPDKIDNPVIAGAITRWQKQSDTPEEPFTFKVHDKGWWAGFKALGNDKRAFFWIGTAIPEADFIGDSGERRTIVLSLVALVLLTTVLIAIKIVKRYSQNLQVEKPGLYSVDQITEQLIALIAQGEGYKREFKSTMRHNLRDDKPDKGMELAWLKAVVGFLNSDGGILFIGVADDGTVLGLDADNFANEDKCLLHFKNLVSQHIGLEYSRYIHLDLITHNEKQVAVVQCEKANTPVFLKIKNDEEFYIRSGPSSTKLTGSKLLKYLGHGKSEPGK